LRGPCRPRCRPEPMPVDPGAVTDRRDHARRRQDPSEHRRRRQDPGDLTASRRRRDASSLGPRPAHSRLTVPTPRTSVWRSANPRRSDAVLAYSARPPPTGPRIRRIMRTPEAARRQLHT
jgi:hypothetical protein